MNSLFHASLAAGLFLSLGLQAFAGSNALKGLTLDRETKTATATATCETFLIHERFSHPEFSGYVITISGSNDIFSGVPKEKEVTVQGPYRIDSRGFAPQLKISDVQLVNRTTTMRMQKPKTPVEVRSLTDTDPLILATQNERLQEWYDANIMNDYGILVEARAITNSKVAVQKELATALTEMTRSYLLKRYEGPNVEAEFQKLAFTTTFQNFEPKLPSSSSLMKLVLSEGRFENTDPRENRNGFTEARNALKIPLRALGATEANTIVALTRTEIYDENFEKNLPFTAISFVNRDTGKLLVIWVKHHTQAAPNEASPKVMSSDEVILPLGEPLEASLTTLTKSKILQGSVSQRKGSNQLSIRNDGNNRLQIMIGRLEFTNGVNAKIEAIESDGDVQTYRIYRGDELFELRLVRSDQVAPVEEVSVYYRANSRARLKEIAVFAVKE